MSGYPENLGYTIGYFVTSSWSIIYSGKEGLVITSACYAESCESYFYCLDMLHLRSRAALKQQLQQLKQVLNQELSFFSSVVRASVGFPRKLVLKHQIFHKH